MKPTIRLGVLASFAAALALAAACSSSSPTTSTSSGSSGTTTAANTPPPATTAPSTSTAGTTHAADTGTMSSAAGAATAMAGGNVASLLGSSLGLTSDQSSGAVGSYLTYAQEKLPASDYSKVAAAVPGADSYVQKAKDLGAVTGAIGDTNGLNAAYAKLGISPEVASKVTPLVTQYISKSAGPTVGGLLSGIAQ